MSAALATLWQQLFDSRAAAAVPAWLPLLVAGALAAMLLEALLLLAWHRRCGGGLPPRSLLPTLVAGGGLMGALLLLLTGAPLAWLLGLLAVAGAGHVLDLRRRWQPGRRQR